MEIIFDEILRALGYLLITGIVCFAYKTAHDNAEGNKYKSVLLKGFLWCAGLALFASFTLGAPSCEQAEDYLYGGCEQYADNGYEPTAGQRIAKFFYYMTLLYIPVAIGAFKKRYESSKE